jgi:hypothetical protein
MTEQRLRDGVRDLVESFGPTSRDLILGLRQDGREDRRPAQRWLAAGAAILLAALAVGTLVYGLRSSRTSPATSIETLRARPLEAPAVDPSACRLPTGWPRVAESGGVSYYDLTAPGGGPITIKGPLGSSGDTALLELDTHLSADFGTPALFRTRRLYGLGTAQFPKGAGYETEHVINPPPDREAAVPAQDSILGLMVTGPGCYTLQVDGPGYSGLTVFQVGVPVIRGPVPVTVATPEAAIGIVHRNVGDISPTLFPEAPAGWKAEVALTGTSYSVVYTSPDGKQSVRIQVVAGYSAPAGASSRTAARDFRGDPGSRYTVADPAAPGSQRDLTWSEPGRSSLVPGQVPYLFQTTGIDDDGFWRLAGSLRAR